MDGPVRKKVLEEASKNLERASMSPVTAFLKLRPYLSIYTPVKGKGETVTVSIQNMSSFSCFLVCLEARIFVVLVG